jgi:hypothetical protein
MMTSALSTRCPDGAASETGCADGLPMTWSVLVGLVGLAVLRLLVLLVLLLLELTGGASPWGYC